MSALTRLPPDVAERVPLGRYTSLHVGGPAHRFLASDDVGALARLLDAARMVDAPSLVLGGGSNLLIADHGFDGIVVKYTRSGHRVDPDRRGGPAVRAEAGTSLSSLARRLARAGLAGLEWAATVPGTVGGAVVNNAGAFGGSTAEHVVEVELVGPGGDARTLAGDELGYAYRTSVLKRGELGPVVVRSATLRVYPDAPDLATARILGFQAQRTASQPRQLSAGSIFANPPGDYAGRLIEAAGLKGARRGGAEISTQHANFIVNGGAASARDVLGLIRLAQDAVWERFGIWLQPEVQLAGAWDPGELAVLDGPPGRGAR
jgi:UDP-N-acetylmuramate dehydrogenase